MVLTHLLPDVPVGKPRFEKGGYGGKVTVGDDLAVAEA